VRQIVANLTSNAIKFTANGGVYVKLVDGIRPGHVTLIIRDTGIGISADRIEAIFQSFTQADGSTARQYGGTGLGLTIVKSLVNLMNGEVELESEINVGTTFRIHLPLPETDEPVRSRTDELSGIIAALGLRILLVEDNFVNQMVAREALVQMGCEVIVCDSGEAALEKFMPGRFRAVLMDIQMPGMDGFETARRLRELEVGTGHRSAIIALSAHAMESAKIQALEAGMDDHLAKPMRQRDLREVILRNLH
jgi:CheY-like chemotaxis protein/anti-sigma regulatory factor (Ser/Thr protein kinase)